MYDDWVKKYSGMKLGRKVRESLQADMDSLRKTVEVFEQRIADLRESYEYEKKKVLDMEEGMEMLENDCSAAMERNCEKMVEMERAIDRAVKKPDVREIDISKLIAHLDYNKDYSSGISKERFLRMLIDDLERGDFEV